MTCRPRPLQKPKSTSRPRCARVSPHQAMANGHELGVQVGQQKPEATDSWPQSCGFVGLLCLLLPLAPVNNDIYHVSLLARAGGWPRPGPNTPWPPASQVHENPVIDNRADGQISRLLHETHRYFDSSFPLPIHGQHGGRTNSGDCWGFAEEMPHVCMLRRDGRGQSWSGLVPFSTACLACLHGLLPSTPGGSGGSDLLLLASTCETPTVSRAQTRI